MYHPQINSVQIKIVGLLGDFSKKDAAIYQKKLINSGFYIDDYPVVNEQNSIKKKLTYFIKINSFFIVANNNKPKKNPIALIVRYPSDPSKKFEILIKYIQ